MQNNIRLDHYFKNINLALSKKNLISLHANTKDTDQPAHLPSLVSAFAVCSLESAEQHKVRPLFQEHKLGLIKVKPDIIACKHQRHRPACASAQSGQCLCCLLPRKCANKLTTCKISILVSPLTEQAGIKHTLLVTPITGFLVMVPNYSSIVNEFYSLFLNSLKVERVNKIH